MNITPVYALVKDVADPKSVALIQDAEFYKSGAFKCGWVFNGAYHLVHTNDKWYAMENKYSDDWVASGYIEDYACFIIPPTIEVSAQNYDAAIAYAKEMVTSGKYKTLEPQFKFGCGVTFTSSVPYDVELFKKALVSLFAVHPALCIDIKTIDVIDGSKVHVDDFPY